MISILRDLFVCIVTASIATRVPPRPAPVHHSTSLLLAGSPRGTTVSSLILVLAHGILLATMQKHGRRPQPRLRPPWTLSATSKPTPITTSWSTAHSMPRCSLTAVVKEPLRMLVATQNTNFNKKKKKKKTTHSPPPPPPPHPA